MCEKYFPLFLFAETPFSLNFVCPESLFIILLISSLQGPTPTCAMVPFADVGHGRWQRRKFLMDCYSSSSLSGASSASLRNYELEDLDDDIFFEQVEHLLQSKPIKPTWLDSDRAAVNRFDDDAEPNSKTEFLLSTQRDAQRDDGQVQLDSRIASSTWRRQRRTLSRVKLRALHALCHSSSAPSFQRATIQPVTEFFV